LTQIRGNKMSEYKYSDAVGDPNKANYSHEELKILAANGGMVQYLSHSGTWEEVVIPEWNTSSYYRVQIVPEPVPTNGVNSHLVTHRCAQSIARQTPYDNSNDEPVGIKYDKDKVNLEILTDLPLAITAMAEVLQLGADKYGRENYQYVATRRYTSAMLRHVFTKETFDKDLTDRAGHNVRHAAAIAANALIFLELTLSGEK